MNKHSEIMLQTLMNQTRYFMTYLLNPFAANQLKLKGHQGHSHQNLSGQVEIISQTSTYSDFQIIVIVVHSMHSIYYRGVGTGPADPATAGPKFPAATPREPTINNKC